jgi:hypothetical protein
MLCCAPCPAIVACSVLMAPFVARSFRNSGLKQYKKSASLRPAPSFGLSYSHAPCRSHGTERSGVPGRNGAAVHTGPKTVSENSVRKTLGHLPRLETQK